MEVRDLLTRFGADTSGFKKGAAEVKSELTNLNRDFYANQKAMKEVNDELKKLEKAQKELRAAMANGGTDEQRLAYDKLGKEIDALAIKKAQLKTNEQELKGQISATTNELREQASIADKNKISMADIETGLKRLATGYLGVTAAIFAFGAKMGKNADDLNTMSKVTGLTTAELQKFAYASEIIDVSADTLTGSMAKMIKNMANAQKGTGDAKKAFEDLGIAYENNGQLIDKNVVFSNTIDALAKVGNETERDAKAMQIFGKSAQDLNPLILGGADALKQLGDEAERNGLILSQEQLDKLNVFNDKIDTFKAKLSQLSMTAGTEVVDAFDGLWDSADDVVGIVKDLAVATSKVIGFTIEHKDVILALIVAYGTFKTSMTIGTLISGVASAVKTLSTANQAAAVSQTALNTAVKANPYVLLASVIMGAISVIATLAFTSGGASKKVDQLADAMKNAEKSGDDLINSANAENQIILLKAQKYEDLRKSVGDSTIGYDELKAAADDLQSSLPNEIDMIDKQTGLYKNLGETIASVAKAKLESAKMQASTDELVVAYKNIEDLQDKIDEKNKKLASVKGDNTIANKAAEEIRLMGAVTVTTNVQLNSHAEHIRVITSELAGLNDEQDIYERKTQEIQDKFGNTEKWVTAYMPTADLAKMKAANQKAISNATTDAIDTTPQVATGFANSLNKARFSLDMDVTNKSQYYNTLKSLLSQYRGSGKAEYQEYYKELHSMEKDFANESLAAQQKAQENQLKAQKEAEELYTTAIKKLSDERISAIDAEIAARNKLKDTQTTQKEIDSLNALIKYEGGSQGDAFSKNELIKNRDKLLQQQSDTAWQDQMTAKKQQIQTATDYMATAMQGTQTPTSQSIVNNNNRSANVNLALAGMTSGQVSSIVAQQLRDLLGI